MKPCRFDETRKKTYTYLQSSALALGVVRFVLCTQFAILIAGNCWCGKNNCVDNMIMLFFVRIMLRLTIRDSKSRRNVRYLTHDLWYTRLHDLRFEYGRPTIVKMKWNITIVNQYSVYDLMDGWANTCYQFQCSGVFSRSLSQFNRFNLLTFNISSLSTIGQSLGFTLHRKNTRKLDGDIGRVKHL